MGNVRWCEPEAICTDPDPARREFRKWVLGLRIRRKPRKVRIPPGHWAKAITPGPGMVTYVGDGGRRWYGNAKSKRGRYGVSQVLLQCACGTQFRMDFSRWKCCPPDACFACWMVCLKRNDTQCATRAA